MRDRQTRKSRSRPPSRRGLGGRVEEYHFYRRQSPAGLAADLAPWTHVGIAVMLTTGPLMFSTDAVAYHYNPSFQFKMVCLMLALLLHFTLHRRAVLPDAPPIAAKLAAVVSLLLWTAVVAGGRMIAFI